MSQRQDESLREIFDDPALTLSSNSAAAKIVIKTEAEKTLDFTRSIE